MTGDGSIVALVGGLSAADAYTKACVMIRDHARPSSPHDTCPNGTQCAYFQRRKTRRGWTEHTGPIERSAIVGRRQRQGTTITGSYSWDGVNWATAGSDTIAMGSTVYVGLAATPSWVGRHANFLNASIGGVRWIGGYQVPSRPRPRQSSPSVTLTSPGFGANFSAPARDPLTATASDPMATDGGVVLLGTVPARIRHLEPIQHDVVCIPTAVLADRRGPRQRRGMTVSSERVVSVGTGAQTAVFVALATMPLR